MRFHGSDVWVSMDENEVVEFIEELTPPIMEEIPAFKGVNIKQATHVFAENFLYMLSDKSVFDEFSVYFSDVRDVSEDEVYNKIANDVIHVIQNILEDCVIILTKEELADFECADFDDYGKSDDDIFKLYEIEDKCWYLENAYGYKLDLSQN